MKTTGFLILVTLLLAGCRPASDSVTETEPMMTIENSPSKVTPVELPPTIDENAPPPPRNDTAATGTAALPLPPAGPESKDAALLRKMELPFAPAIAMDIVDGTKVTINAATPVAEYKKKLYYFITPENKRTFLANPEQFMKGTFSRY